MSRPVATGWKRIRLTLSHDGRGGLALALADAGAASNAYRNESRDQSDEYFFHWNSPFFTPRDTHFVPRCTVGRTLKPMVHRLRRQWGTSKETVSLGTQLRGVRRKTCQRAAADRPPGTHHSPSISGLNSRAGGCAKASC